MSKAAAIEINDASLWAAHGGKAYAGGPGYALFVKETVLTGEQARKVSRVEPLNIDNRYWQEPGVQPLSQPAAGGRSRADLALAQLSSMWKEIKGSPESVAFAVPGTLGGAELSVLLSVARECGIPVSGFIDSAVAVASAWGGHGRFVYVDVHLHRAVITAVDVAGTQVRRERVEASPRAGLLPLYDAWMKALSRSFVTRTRFDPLYNAGTEQVLFDALPGFLEALGTQNEVQAQVTFGKDVHRVPLTREEILLAAAPLYSQIVLAAHRLRRSGQPLAIALSAGAAALPGLAESFAEFHDCQIVACIPGCAALAAALHAEHWPANADTATLFRAVSALPTGMAAPLIPALIRGPEGQVAARAPTHVLYQGRAHPLGPQPLVVGAAPSNIPRHLQIVDAAAGISRLHCSLLRTPAGAEVIDYSRYGTWLNDESVAGRAPLRAGDRLRLGNPGITLELIAID